MASQDSSEVALEGGSAQLLENAGSGGEVDWLMLARRSYESSTDYMSSNLRRQWERNINNFLSRHSPGSKYYTTAYKHRSRLFRPKTRASERSKEAALVVAFFSTSEAVTVAPADESDQLAADSARVMHEIVNQRLKKTLNWFKIVIGAFQEAWVMGTVVSHQYWDYEERVHKKPTQERVYDPEIGNEVVVEGEEDETEVIRDEPVIELVENENFRIDPGASWLDPIKTSPYVIHLIPMYLIDVLDRMGRGDDTKTNQPRWKKMTVQEILRASTTSSKEFDSTRLTREGDRQDPKTDQYTDVSEYTIVWVHRNIMRMPGKGDMLYYTLGTSAILSDPVPLDEVYLHGRRPYAMGHTVIETFRNYPSGSGELGQDVQAATNDNMNQRFDNIRQILNKRYYVRRNSNVDLRSLRRNVPGSIVMMGDVDKDVKSHETSDVTQSSVQEQNLFNADFDEITGQFSSGSVQSNRQLGETVGGMKMLKDPSNTMTEFTLRVFAETWVREVLTQLVALEQAYETDENLIAAAGKKAKVGKVPYNIMKARLDVDVDVGFGVTDPSSRIHRLMYGLETTAKLVPGAMQRTREDAVLSEVWGILGYQKGERFFYTAEEMAKNAEQNPPPPSEIQLKIESAEKIAGAELELKRLVEAAKIMSQERIKAAELSVQTGEAASNREVETLGAPVEIARVDIEAFNAETQRKKIEYDREDSIRKDREIRDVESSKIQSGGSK